MRDMSMMMLGDCFSAFRIVCSRVFGVKRSGDLISYSTPSTKMSGTFRSVGIKNSTLCPAEAKISATRNSCGHGYTPDGIIILVLFHNPRSIHNGQQRILPAMYCTLVSHRL